jgi:hypothetical protein
MTQEEIIARFTYHAPKEDQATRYDAIRKEACGFALMLHLWTPESREQSLALTHLEQVVMFANAAIARNE